MASAKLDGTSNPVMTFWLSRELEKEIPEIDIYGSERKLLEFAYRDLETCLKANWKDINFEKIEEALDNDHDEIKEFLKIWTKQWLEKWRERVTFSQKTQRFSLTHAKAKKKATAIFKHMKNGQELKDMVVQKLVNSGEVCMAELIAENLIIEGIAQHLTAEDQKTANKKETFEAWDIFQEVSPRIRQITEKKSPLIHLKLMMLDV